VNNTHPSSRTAGVSHAVKEESQTLLQTKELTIQSGYSNKSSKIPECLKKQRTTLLVKRTGRVPLRTRQRQLILPAMLDTVVAVDSGLRLLPGYTGIKAWYAIGPIGVSSFYVHLPNSPWRFRLTNLKHARALCCRKRCGHIEFDITV